MILQQFYLQSLGHASYLVGSEQTGEALVLDVRRDVDVYLTAARQHGMRIRYAADTHQHNDYLTGICELPARAEVQLLAGARADVAQCLNLQHLPAVPPYWRRMRQLNQAGPPRLGVLPEPPALRPEAFERLQRAGAVVLDCRQPEAFVVHIPGALNVGLGSSFATWAGTVLPAEAAVLLVLEDPGEVWEACWQLLRIGYDLPKGWLAGGMLAWRTAGKALAHLPQWTVWDLQQHLAQDRDLTVLDVRQPQEWSEGHIAEALFITGAELPGRSDEVPRDRPVAVICGSGYRSSAMASLLQHRGHHKVVNILGGMQGWRAAGMKTVQD